tara:strand:+ start:5941 stop:6639 length:699 start_codon:yes stop_codon:yes gene_type:complete
MKNLFIILSIFLISCSSSYDVDDAEKVFSEKYPKLKIESIEKVDNSFFEIIIKDQIFYLTTDLKHLLAGNIIDLKTGNNLTESRIKKHRLSLLKNILDIDTIIYKPKKTSHVITIFTDTSCPYCKKLHDEIDDLLKNNIEVRYVLFSRNGKDDGAYRDMVSIWCSKNKKELIEKAFNDDFLSQKSCENPLDKNYQLGYELRVNGTPMIFTENGTVIPGYLPYKRIIEILNSG